MNQAININHLDRTVDPRDDFYHFVNGGWLKETEIPDDRGAWGSFHELSKQTDRNVIAILESELATPGPAENKAARLFETGMDVATNEKAKLTAISDLFDRINTLHENKELFSFLGHITPKGMPALLQFSIHPDLANSTRYAAYVEAGHLGLPEREYYLDQDQKSTEIREAYKKYIHDLLVMEAGYTDRDAHEAAAQILALEKKLAEHMLPKEDRRQIDKLYNPYSYEELCKFTREISWEAFFGGMQVSVPGSVIVTEPAYLDYLNKHINSVPRKILQHYLRFMIIHHVASVAHDDLYSCYFDLYLKTLEGITAIRPLKERRVKEINQVLGESLGELFVSKYFPPEAKEAALEMGGDIVEALNKRIQKLDWMTPETQKRALEKLSAMTIKIGYPDQWKDYSSLNIKSTDEGGSYLGNMIAVAAWQFRRDADRMENEVDRKEWHMAPQVVNAYYNPMFNEIVFPAAIMQPPFFNWEADAAVNYGGIGAVIGHEITHGFDDQGSRFDKDGNLVEWWTQEDRERFHRRTQPLIRQFDQYYPFEDLPLNGTFTLGENIADLGGLNIAYDALQLYFDRHGRPDDIDGFTPEQRFFMSWATVWRTKIRTEALRKQIKTDPHPPGIYRAMAAPSNMEVFYKAVNVYPDSKWYRKEEDRIKIW